jgi:hypothetical protein
MRGLIDRVQDRRFPAIVLTGDDIDSAKIEERSLFEGAMVEQANVCKVI